MKFNTASNGVQTKTTPDCDVTTVKFQRHAYLILPTCSYSEFVGSYCGLNSGNPANIQCDIRQVQPRYQWKPEILQSSRLLSGYRSKALLIRAGNFFLPVNRCNQGVIHSTLNLVCCLIHFELNLYPQSHILKGIGKIFKLCHAIDP